MVGLTCPLLWFSHFTWCAQDLIPWTFDSMPGTKYDDEAYWDCKHITWREIYWETEEEETITKKKVTHCYFHSLYSFGSK